MYWTLLNVLGMATLAVMAVAVVWSVAFLGREALRTHPARKSTFSRTPQSGHGQSSGTSDHAVPAGKPSRGSPAVSS